MTFWKEVRGSVPCEEWVLHKCLLESYGEPAIYLGAWCKQSIFMLMTIKKAERQELMLLKTLESPLDSKEIKLVNPKGNQPWVFTGRTDGEAEVPMLRSPDSKSWLIGKDPDARKDWRQEEKGMIEYEIFGWHHQFNGHEFKPTPGDSEGQGSLACCSPWDHKELDMTEWLNNNKEIYRYHMRI